MTDAQRAHLAVVRAAVRWVNADTATDQAQSLTAYSAAVKRLRSAEVALRDAVTDLQAAYKVPEPAGAASRKAKGRPQARAQSEIG